MEKVRPSQGEPRTLPVTGRACTSQDSKAVPPQVRCLWVFKPHYKWIIHMYIYIYAYALLYYYIYNYIIFNYIKCVFPTIDPTIKYL